MVHVMHFEIRYLSLCGHLLKIIFLVFKVCMLDLKAFFISKRSVFQIFKNDFFNKLCLKGRLQEIPRFNY